MSHFSSSSAIASLNDFLTLLMVMIVVVFSFYLAVMFALGAIDCYSLHPVSSPSYQSSQDVPAIVFQDTIQPFKRSLTHLTIRQLKQRAKEAHISKYSRMTKSQLVTALRAA
jgi:Rho termination factor, N-terminal domain